MLRTLRSALLASVGLRTQLLFIYIFIRSLKAAAQTSSVSQKGVKKSVLAAGQDGDVLEALSDQLVANLSRLIVRFRDDEKNLAILSQVLPCCDISSSSLHQKSMKAILSSLSDLLTTSQNEELIEIVCVALRDWLKLGGTAASQVEATLKDLLSASVKKVEDTQNLINGGLKSTSVKGKGPSKGGKPSESDIYDALFGLSSSITLLSSLWSNADCRHMLKEVVAHS